MNTNHSNVCLASRAGSMQPVTLAGQQARACHGACSPCHASCSMPGGGQAAGEPASLGRRLERHPRDSCGCWPAGRRPASVRSRKRRGARPGPAAVLATRADYPARSSSQGHVLQPPDRSAAGGRPGRRAGAGRLAPTARPAFCGRLAPAAPRRVGALPERSRADMYPGDHPDHNDCGGGGGGDGECGPATVLAAHRPCVAVPDRLLGRRTVAADARRRPWCAFVAAPQPAATHVWQPPLPRQPPAPAAISARCVLCGAVWGRSLCGPP
eukprot:COSAG01_NODE_20197_length_966_cov_0.709343_1_plen_269_part_00